MGIIKNNNNFISNNLRLKVNLSKRSKDFIDAADIDGNIRNNQLYLICINKIDEALKKSGITEGASYIWIGNNIESYRVNFIDPSQFILDYSFLANEPTAVENGISFNNNSLAVVTNDAREIFMNGSGTMAYYSVNNDNTNGTIITADPVGDGVNTAALYKNFEGGNYIDMYNAGGGGRAMGSNNGNSSGITLGTRNGNNDLRLYKNAIIRGLNTATQTGSANALNTPLVIGGDIYTYRSNSIGGFALVSPQGLTDIKARIFSIDIINAMKLINR